MKGLKETLKRIEDLEQETNKYFNKVSEILEMLEEEKRKGFEFKAVEELRRMGVK